MMRDLYGVESAFKSNPILSHTASFFNVLFSYATGNDELHVLYLKFVQGIQSGTGKKATQCDTLSHLSSMVLVHTWPT